MTTPRDKTTGGKGPSVDAGGSPVIDPTENVRALVEAESRRQDDIRRLVDEHARELRKLTSGYEDKLRLAESARIDAIRKVDVEAVARAAQESTDRANTLALQVAASAETLRANVATVAAAAATSMTAALTPIIKAVEDLRQSQYQLQGEKTQKSEGKGDNQWIVGVVCTLLGIGVTLLGIGVTWLVLHK